MITERLSSSLAKWITDADPDSPFSYNGLNYMAKVSINLVSVYLICGSVGFFSGYFIDSVSAVSAFAILRMFSGGFHFKSLDVCTVFSSAILAPIPFMAKSVDLPMLYIITSLTALIILIKAPKNLKIVARINMRIAPIYKLIAVTIVVLNFLLMSPVLCLSFLFQALLLLPKKGGESI